MTKMYTRNIGSTNVNTALLTAVSVWNRLSIKKGVKQLMVVCLFLCTGMMQQSWGQSVTQPFTYTGANQTFTVPTGVTSITISMWGAGGAGSGSSAGSGGSGAYVSGTMSVTPGQQLLLVVGGGGSYSASTTAAYGGGGVGGANTYGGGGGGYTGIFSNSVTQGNAVTIAGGGGGGGYYSSATYGGGGGATTGVAGGNESTTYTGGAGGTNSVGGAGGLYNNVANGTAGTALTGGGGKSATIGGGGGGGGYFGGGGGYGGTSTTYYSSGGGGGSSYLGSLTATTNTVGTTNSSGTTATAPGTSVTGYVTGVGNGGALSTVGGNGLILITYIAPACTTPSAPTGTLSLTATAGLISGTFTAPSTAPTGYIVVRTTSNSAPTAPTTGTSYTVGSTLGTNMVVVANNTSTGFSDYTVSTSAGVTYWYWVYSYNNTYCTGGPLYSSYLTNSSGATTIACTTATNTLVLSTTTGTTTNWSTGSWTLGHAPLPCENAVVTWNPTTSSANQTGTLNIDVPINVNSLTITTTGSSTSKYAELIVQQTGTNTITIANGLSITTTGAKTGTTSYTEFMSAANMYISGAVNIGNSGTCPSYIGAYGTSTPSFYFYGNVTFGNGIGGTNYALNGTASPTYYFDAISSQTLTMSATNTLYNTQICFPNMVVGYANTPTLTITGTNTYPVYTNGNLTINNAATLILNSGIGVDNFTASAGTFTINNGGKLNLLGTTYPTNAANYRAGSNFPYFGTYNFGSGSTVEYDGTATQTVYATVTYGNLIIGDATSTPASTGTVGTSTVTSATGSTIISGATLIGTGTVSGSVDVKGTISPNTSGTIGTLTTGNLTLDAGGTFYVDINNVTGTAGTNWDKLVAGTLTNSATSGSKFTISVNGTITGFSSTTSTSWVIGTYTGTAPSTSNIVFTATGSLSSYVANLSVSFASNNITITYGVPPTVSTTTPPSPITATAATMGGNVTATGGATISGNGIVYSLTATNASPAIGGTGVTQLATSGAGTGTGAFSDATSVALSPNTQYSYAAYATNNINTAYGAIYTFYTLGNSPTAPVVSSPTTTTLNVAIGSGDGNPSSTTYAIQETTTGLYLQSTSGALEASAVYNTASAWGTATVTGLSSNVGYVFAAYSKNTSGTVSGIGASSATAYTLAATPTAPTVNGATTSTLNVAIGSGDGNSAATTYAIYLTTTGQYVQSNGSLGSSAVYLSASSWGTTTVTGLSASTSYTFEVKGQNGAGTTTAYGPTTTVSTISNSTPTCPDNNTLTPNSTQIICQSVTAGTLTAGITTTGTAGTPTLQYQWYYNTTNSNTVSGATSISGATNSTYTPPSTGSEGTRYYFCVGYATDNTCGQSSTTQGLASISPVQVTVNTSPTYSGVSASSSVLCSGSSATITLSGLMNVAQNISYTIGGTSGTQTVSVTGSGGAASFNTIALTAANSGQTITITGIARIDVTPNCNITPVSSNTASLPTVYSLPTLTGTSTGSTSLCTNGTATITLNGILNVLQTVNYTVGGTSGTQTASVTGSGGTGSFSTIALGTANSGQTVTITSINITGTSGCPLTPVSNNTATLPTVNANPTVTTATASPATVCSGSTVTLNGTATTPTTFNVGPVSEASANLTGISTASTYVMYFSSTNAATINSINVYPYAAGAITFTLYNTSGSVVASTSYTFSGGSTTTPVTVPLGFSIPAGASYYYIGYSGTINRGASTYSYPYSGGNGFTITGNGYDGNPTTGGTRVYFYNWSVTVSTNITSNYNWTWSTTGAGGTNVATGGTNNGATGATATPINSGSSQTSVTYTAIATKASTGCSGSMAIATPINVNPYPTAPANNGTAAAQCGSQAIFNATSSASIPTYNFYTASSGGTAIGTSTNGNFTYTTGMGLVNDGVTKNYLYVSVTPSGGCESPRTQIPNAGSGVVVSTAPAVTITKSSANTCVNSVETLTTVLGNPGDYNTFLWSGGNGDDLYSDAGTTTLYANNNITTVYHKESSSNSGETITVTATNSTTGCVTTQSTSFIVNPLPVVTTATTSPSSSVCSGSTVTLNATSVTASAGTSSASGTGTSSSSVSGYPTGFGTYNYQDWQQYIFKASELNAMGLYGGNITALQFNIKSVSSGNPSNYTISMANTTNTTTSTTFVTTGLTTVYGPISSQSNSTGWNTITFSAPFNWDGSSNVLIDIRELGSNSLDNAATYYTTTSYNSVAYAAATSNTTGFYTSAPTATTSTSRPNIIFAGQVGTNTTSSYNWTWSNTGAGGTNVATGGTNNGATGATVTPTNTGSTGVSVTYTAIATNASTGCTNSLAASAITVNPIPSVPTVANGSQCGAGVNSTATVTSTSGASTPTFNWYALSATGSPLQSSTATNYATSVSATTSLWVTESGGGCESSPRQNIIITVNNPSTVNSSGGLVPTSGYPAGSGYAGVSVTINGTNLSNINTVYFNGTAATPTANTSTSITVTVPTGATTGNITFTDACSNIINAGSFTVTTYNPCTGTPTAPTLVVGSSYASNSSTGISICSGGTANLTATNTSSGTVGFTYSWYSSTTSATASDFSLITTTTNPNYTTAAATQETWYYCVTNCTLTSTSSIQSNVVAVNIYNTAVTITPTTTGSTNAATYCGYTNAPVQLTASSVAGADYFTWTAITGLYTNNPATTAYATNGHSTTVYAAPTGTVTYTATANYTSKGCASATGTQTVSIGTPVKNFSVTPSTVSPAYVCPGSSQQLQATINPAASNFSFASTTSQSFYTIPTVDGITSTATTGDNGGSPTNGGYFTFTPTSGFSFPFNGSNFTSFSPGTNGYVVLGSTGSENFGEINQLTGLNAIFGYGTYGNFNGANGGQVQYGAISGGKYVIEFDKLAIYYTGGGANVGVASATRWGSFQIVLWGSTSSTPGRIDVIYGANGGTASNLGSNWWAGICDANNTYLNGGDGGGTDGTTALNTTGAWLTSGTMYSYIPPSANISYTWTDPSNYLSSTSTNNPVFNNSNASLSNGNYTFPVAATNSVTGCSATATAEVTVQTVTLSVSAPTASASSTCNGFGTKLIGTSSITGGCPPYTAQWLAGGVAVGSPITLSTATSVDTLTVYPTATTTYSLKITDNSSTVVTSSGITVTVSNPQPISVTPNSVCTSGTVALSATPQSGDNIIWLSGSSNNSTELANTSAYTTPSISTTTTYYAADNNGGGNYSSNIIPYVSGNLAGYITPVAGMQFNATAPFIINSVVIYPYANPSTTVGTITIQLLNSTGTVLQSIAVNNITATSTAAAQTVYLGFPVPVGTGYQLVETAVGGGINGIETTSGTISNNSYAGGAMVLTASVEGTATSTSGFYGFYNWSVTTGCTGTPVAVIATVTTPATIAISDNSQVSTKSLAQSTNNNEIATGTLTIAANSATITGVTFTLPSTATYVAADIATNGFTLWASTTNNLATATSLGSVSSAKASGSAETLTFSGISSNNTFAAGTVYYWLTASISASATVNHTINVNSQSSSNFTFSSCHSTPTGTTSATGIETIVADCSGTPVAATLANSSINVCTNQTVTTLSATDNNSSTVSGYTYQWYTYTNNTGSGASAISNQTSLTYTPSDFSGAGTHYIGLVVTCQFNSTSSTPVIATVNVGAPPALSISSTGTINTCTGNINTINVTSNTSNFNTYVWSSSLGATSNLYTNSGATTNYTGTGNPTTVYYENAGTTTGEIITLTATENTYGCIVTKTADYVVFTTPVISTVTASPATICSGSTVTLGATMPTTSFNIGKTTIAYTATAYTSGIPLGMYISTTNAASINSIQVFPSSTGNITIQLLNASNAVQATQNFTISSTSKTVAQTLSLTGFNIPAGATGWSIIYTGSSAAIPYSDYNGGTASFTFPTTSNGFSIVGETSTSTTTSFVNGVYYPFFNWNVTVTPNTTSAFSWSWSTTGTGGTNVAGSSTYTQSTEAATATASNTGSSTASVVYTVTASANGCSANASATAISVSPIPGTPTNNGTVSSQCGTPYYQATGAISGETYNWYTVATGGTAIVGATAASYSYAGFGGATGTYNLWVSKTNAGGCEGARLPLTVNVTSLPASVSITQSASQVCVNGIANFTATLVNPGDYNNFTWSTVDNTDLYQNSGATSAYSNQNISTIYYKETSAQTEVITLVANNTTTGCSNTATATITVNALPNVATVTASPATLCNGSNITLGSTATGSTSFNVGNASESSGNLTASTTTRGMYFSTTTYSATINSISIYPNAAGTFAIALYNTGGTATGTQQGSTVYVTINSGDISKTNLKVIPLGFTIPAGSTNWEIVATAGLSFNYGFITAGAYTYPQTSNGFSITGNTTDGDPYTGTAGKYWFFYNWNISTTIDQSANFTWNWNIASTAVTPVTTNTSGSQITATASNSGTSPASVVYTAVATNGTTGCVNSLSATAVTVDPTSAGGTATASASSICTGSNTTITLSGNIGTIQWQSSLNGSTGWANVTTGSGATSATYTTPNLTVTTYYRAVVTSGVCSLAYSSTASVTVSPASVGGTATASPTSVTYNTNTSIIGLTGYTGTIQWQQSADGSTGWTNVTTGTGGTTASYTTADLTTTTYYRASVSSGSCSIAYSNVVSVSITKATPTITTVPTASAITYGQTLASSTLTGGVASYNSTTVPGTWTYTTPSTLPPAGTDLETYTFTPTDGTDYNSITNSTVYIIVNKATPAISGVTPSQSISYGTSSVTLSGTVSAGSVYPPDGETISVTINGVSQTTTTTGGNGGFSITYTTGSIPASATAYTITYSYAGDANFNAATNNTNTTLTVSKSTPTISVSGIQTFYYNGSSQGPSTISYTGDATPTLSYTGISGTIYGPSATAPIGNGTFVSHYQVVASATATSNYNAVTSAAYTFTISPSAYSWVGGTSGHLTDWNTATNWAGLSVPTSTSDVTILSSTYYPALTATSNVHNLYIEAGTVSLNGHSLTINGAVTGSGLLVGSSAASLIMNSSSNNTLNFRANSSTDTLVSNLTLSGTGTVTLGSGLGITNLLSLNAAANLNLNGHHLTLKSTSITNTAEVGVVSSGATVTGGNVTVERYIPLGLRQYRDLGPSVYNAGSVFNNWQEGGYYSTSDIYGMFITGSYNKAYIAGSYNPVTGADYTTTGNPSLYTYIDNVWAADTLTKATNLDPFQGMRALVRGARNFNLIQQFPNMVTATTLRATGQLVTGTVTFTTSGTSSTSGATSGYGLTDGANNWSLIANPYACPIDWASIWGHNGSNNITSSYSYLDPTFLSSGYSIYVTYNGASGVTSNAPSGTREFIQSGQGFFVQNDVSGTPRLVINETDKAPSSTHTSVFGNTKPNMLAITLNRNLNGSSSNIDGAVAVFNTNYTKSIGAEDSRKLMNPAENLYITESANNLSIDGLPTPSLTDVVALKLANVIAGETYQLNVDASQYAGLDAYIHDAYLNTDVSVTNPVTFTPTSDAATYANRFSIVFKANVVAVNNATKISVYPNPVTEKVFTIQTQNVAAGKYNVSMINAMGQTVMTTTINHAAGVSNETISMDRVLSSGMYTVVLKSADGKLYQSELLAQ